MNSNQLIDALELIVAWLAKIPRLPILILFSVIGLGFGVLMIINPALVIEIQRRFYAKINWKIEPISMEKEIRNTRIMGGLLVIVLIAIWLLLFINRPLFP